MQKKQRIKLHQKRNPSTFFKIIHYLLHIVNIADFFSDLYVFYIILNTKNTGWASSSIIFMLAPYLIIYTPMVSILVTQTNTSKNKNYIIQFLNSFFTLLFSNFFSLFLMIIIDLLVVLFHIIYNPIRILIKILTFNTIILSDAHEVQ